MSVGFIFLGLLLTDQNGTQMAGLLVPGGYPPQMQSQFVQGMQGYAAYGQFGYQPG